MMDLKEILRLHELWLNGNFSGVRANLRGEDLSDSDFCGVNLSDSDLTYANLDNSDMRSANLAGAILRGANLNGVNLDGANLYGTIGNGREIQTIQTETWAINITDSVIQIGCTRFDHDQLMEMGMDQVRRHHPRAEEWWKKWKPAIAAILEARKIEDE